MLLLQHFQRSVLEKKESKIRSARRVARVTTRGRVRCQRVGPLCLVPE